MQTARLSLAQRLLLRRYLDRQIRGERAPAYTPTSTKPGDGDPGCLLLRDGSILCEPPPSPAPPSRRLTPASRASSVFSAPTALFPFNPFHPSSHIPIFTHHRTVSLIPFTSYPLRRPPFPLPLPSPPAVSLPSRRRYTTAASFTLGGLVHRCTG